MDDLQDDRLRALVKMAREDFDEEPPARIDALLMAAARHHAPPPKAGAFERLRRWLAASMMNPATAGATALVVIGGAAGVLYMRNQGRIAEPTVSRQAPVRDEMRATAPEPPTEEELEKHLGAIADGEGVLAPVVPEPVVPDLRQAPRPETKPKGRGTGTFDRTGTSDGPGGSAGGGDSFADTRDADKQVATTEKPPEKMKLEIAEDRGQPIGGVATNMPLVNPPPPPPPPPDTGTVTVQDESVDTRTATNRREAENLLRQARTAAKKKNCPPVKVMAKRAQKLDAAYYTSTFAKDADVKTCL